MKKFHYLLLLLILQNSALAQTTNDLTEVIYNYSFTTAQQNIETCQNNSRFNKNELLLIKANYYWWQYLSGNIANEHLNLCLKTCLSYQQSETIESNVIAFQSAIIFSYIIRIYAAQGKYFNSISFLDKAMPYFEYALENKNKNEGLMLISGLYNYMVSYGLDEHPLFYPYLLFYPSGNKSHGLNLLKNCTKSENIVIQTEARYFLMKINFDIEKNYAEAQPFAEQLIEKYPNNLVYRYEYYKILAEQKLYNKAEQQKNIIIRLSSNNIELNNYQKKHFINLLQNIN